MIPKRQTYTNDGGSTTQTQRTTGQNNAASNRAKSTQTVMRTGTSNTQQRNTQQRNYTAANRAKSTQTTQTPRQTSRTTAQTYTSASNRAKSTVPNPGNYQSTQSNAQAVRTELQANSRSLASINVNQAESTLGKLGEGYNQRVQEDPNYRYSMYQFSNGTETLNGVDYRTRADEFKTKTDNFIASIQSSDEQFKQDGNVEAYNARQAELLSQQQQLNAEYDYLSKFEVSDFNTDVKKTYESNKARMEDIVLTLANLKKNAGPIDQINQLNAEYNMLKGENENLKTLYNDVRYVSESAQLEWAKQYASDDDLATYARYIASEDNSPLEDVLTNLVTSPTRAIYGLFATADILADLGLEAEGSVFKSAANELKENGLISDETFNKISKKAQELQDFSYINNANPATVFLREFNDHIRMTVGNNPNKSELESVATEIINSAVDDFVRREMFGELSTIAMGTNTFADSYTENKSLGYSDFTSLVNATLKGGISYLSENLSTERYFKLAGSLAGQGLTNAFFSVLAENLISMVPEEMLEEGAEYILDYGADYIAKWMQPGFNNPVFSRGDLLKNMLYAGGSTLLTGLLGAAKSSVFGSSNPVPEIKSAKEYNDLKVELEKGRQIHDLTGDFETKLEMGELLNFAEQRARQYERKSVTAGKVELQDDAAKPFDDAAEENLMKQAELPDAKSLADRQEVIDEEAGLAAKYINEMTETVMRQKGIKGLTADQYINLSSEERAIVDDMAGTGISYENYKDMDEATRQEFKQTTQVLNEMGMNNVVERLARGHNGLQKGDYLALNPDQSRTINLQKLASISDGEFQDAIDEILSTEMDEMVDKEGKTKRSNRDLFKKVGMESLASTTASHELSHFLERSGLWKQIRDMVKSEMGETEFNTVKERLGVIYSAMDADSDPEHEVVAFYIQQNIGNLKFLKNLAKYHTSAFERLRSDFGSMIFSKDVKRQFENLFARAYEDAQRETDRQMKELVKSLTGGYIGDNFFSRNKAQLGLAEYNRNGKKLLETFLENQPDLSDEDRKDIMAKMKEVAKVMEDFQKTGKFPEFSNWQNTVYSIDREGNFSVVITNGDYDLNIDFSTVCKKRQMMDKVLNALSKNGYLNGPLTRIQLAKIREIIEKEGLEVACGMCFVDAKRFNQGSWAGKFETKWNGIIDQIVGLMDIEDVTRFDFVAGKSDVSEAMANIDFSDPRLKEIVDKSQGSSEEARMIKAIINDPSLRGYVSTNDLYGSDGFKEMKNQKPALYKLANASGGSSKPKLPHTNILYTNEIEFSDNFNAKDAENVGGVRVQSFSDFMVNMVFDYTQMFADMEAKKLKGHSYTKVKEYALFFGKTGMKINLSIIPAGFDPDVYTAEEIKDIKKNNNKLFQELKKNAGLKANGDYMFDKESFDWDLALEIQNLDGYDKNVGTICVGVSDNHIWKMLDDDNVCMIIPYHRSGISPLVADKMGISTFNDYTLKQNTRFKKDNGRYAKVGKGFDFDFYLGSDKDGVHYPGMIENNYDARATADSYLAWCDANSYLPKFDAFRSHKNYYKLLIDFRAYDKNGNVAPQETINISTGMDMNPVMIDPAKNPKLAELYGNDIGFNNVLQKGLEVSEETEAFQNEMLGPIMDEVVDTLGLKKTQSAIGETNNRYSISPETEKAYDEAVRNNDMETAAKYVRQAAEDYAKQTGQYMFETFHGTNARFNRFLKDKRGSKNIFAESAYKGFFSSGSRKTAEAYTGLNSGDMFHLALAGDSDERLNKIRQEINDKYGLNELDAKQKEGWNAYYQNALNEARRNGDPDLAVLDRLEDPEVRAQLNMSEEEIKELVDSITDTTLYQWNSRKKPGEEYDNLNRLRREYEETDAYKEIEAAKEKGNNELNDRLLEYFGYEPNVKHMFAFMKNPLFHDFHSEKRDEAFSDLLDKALKNGNDGAVFENVQDGSDEYDTIYVVFDPAQYKSADPVTYDDNGNIIPLSKRFDQSTDDLRYSIGETSDDSERYFNTGNKTIDEMMNAIIEDMSEEEFREYMKNGEFTTATAQEVEEDPDVQEEGLWVKEPEGNYIKIDDGYVSNGKTVAWKDSRIDKLIDSIENRQFSYFYGSGSKFGGGNNLYALNISPHEFRALSFIFEPTNDEVWHNEIAKDKYYNGGVIDPERLGGDPSRQMGYMFMTANKDGTTSYKVKATEGNHRSIMLDESGYTKMPILLSTDVPISGPIKLVGMDTGYTRDISNPNSKVIGVGDYVEIKRSNLAKLHEKFGSGANANVQYDIGETDDLNMTDEEMDKYMKQSVPSNKKVRENTDETLAKVLTETPKKKTKKALNDWARKLARYAIFDKYVGVMDLAEKTGNERLKDLVDWAMTSSARAQQTIYNGLYDHEGKTKIGKSLAEILGKLPSQDKQLFYEYMYQWRNVDDMSLTERFGEEFENKPVFGESFTADDSRERIEEIEKTHPEFKGMAQDLWEYTRKLLRMQTGGLISKDGYNELVKQRPHYIPISRDVDGGLGFSSTDANRLLKKMKGSNIDIKNMEETLMNYTRRAYETLDRNNLFNEMANTIGKTQELDNENVDDVLENDNAPVMENDSGKWLTFYKNGKKMSIPVDEFTYLAFKSGYNPIVNTLKEKLKPVAKINQVRKNLLTAWNPFFAARNFSKDLQDAGWNTKYSKTFAKKYTEAVSQIISNGEFFQQFKRLGGGMSNYTAKDLSDAFKHMQENKGMKKFANTLLDFGEYVEMAPRLAEFMASLEAGNTVEKAMYDAAEVTTNFKRGGVVAKTADKYGFTFLNASLQGFDKHVRDLKANSKEAKKAGAKGIVTLLTKLTLASGIPLRLLQDFIWKRLLKDKEYEELSDYIKNNYYILWKTNDGRFVRINKGRIATFYQTVLLNAAETVQGKANLWDNLIEDAVSFIDNIAPNNPLDNNVLAPLSQVKNNKTWYGDEIVSSRLQGYNDWEQYDESTDSLSKAIGRLSKKVADAMGTKQFELSPKKVNYLLDQYSGVIGDVVLPALTLETNTSINNPLLKGPAEAFLNSFTTDPVLKNQNVADFYTLNEQLQKDVKEKNATDEQILSAKYMATVSSEMGKLYGKMHEIQGSDLSNKEKMEQTRALKDQINELARTALLNYDQMDISGQYASVGGVQYYQKDDGSWVKPSKTALEKLDAAGLSDEDRGYYFSTYGEIDTIRKDIKSNTPEGQSADYTQATIDAINDSEMSYKGKNTLLDSFYGGKFTDHVNSMSLNDEEKYNLKVANKLAEGEKDKNGKTVANSKARATAAAYQELGLLDDVLNYIKDNNISPSEMGLSKTVYKELMNGDTSYLGAYSKASKGSSSKKSSKSSSRKKSSGGSKKRSRKRTAAAVKKPTGKVSFNAKAVRPGNLPSPQVKKNYLNAYSSIMNRGSKNVSSASGGTVTCPRCGNRVSAASGRCPICGATL